MCSCPEPATTPACTSSSAPNPRGPASWTCLTGSSRTATCSWPRALSRTGSQTLAIDTPSRPDLPRLSTAELRAERDRLRRQLDQAPRDRSRELARASAHREQAEAALAAHQQPGGRQPPGMLGWLRRGGVQPAQIPGGLAVATQQANRAHDRERELRQHQQHRQGWLEANAHLGPAYRDIVRTLAWQRRATGVAVETDRPGYVLEALGPVPVRQGHILPADGSSWRRSSTYEPHRIARLVCQAAGWQARASDLTPGAATGRVAT
jgi:hypothetical protein